MKRTLFLAACILLAACAARAQTGTSAGTQPTLQTQSGTTGAASNLQANSPSPSNAASTVTRAIVPSGQGVTGAGGGGFNGASPEAVPCPFGVSLSADLTAFGCASDPLGAPTYQVPAEAGATAAIKAPPGFNARSTATSAAANSTSSSSCEGATSSRVGNAGASEIFGSGNC